MTLISPAYVAQLQALAAKEPRWGTSSRTLLDDLPGFATAVQKAGSVLDYGCGAGLLVQAINAHNARGRWSTRALGYDPKDSSRWPMPLPVWRGKFGLVTCTDVMEHVERDSVDSVLKDIASWVKPDGKILFLVATGPAIAVLPATDELPERNAHITVEPMEWWLERFGEAWIEVTDSTKTPNGFIAWCRRREA